MLFPELQQKRFAKIDLNAEAKRWVLENGSKKPNPLLDPAISETFIQECHQRFGVDFSYGGYLEDRSTLWQGSYLDSDQKYIHLGIDINIPAGTAVTAPQPCVVIRIDNDYPEPYGWGNRVIVHDEFADCVVIFGHLQPPESLRIGDHLKHGEVFARIGTASENGGWFPHLHVQIVTNEHYQSLLNNDLRDLDGYGKSADIASLRLHFPDPMPYIGILG